MKKKFKDTAVGKFLLGKIPNVVSSIASGTPAGGIIEAIIGNSDMSEADKEIALEIKIRKSRNRWHNKKMGSGCKIRNMACG
mgnify:CR=1 FL=1